MVHSKSNHECALVSKTTDEDGATEVFAYNPKYTFRLRSTGGGQWAIESVHIGDPAADKAAKHIRKVIDMESVFTDYMLRIPRGPDLFTTYLRKPTMRTSAVALVNWNGVEAVEVKLEAAPGGKEDVISTITRLHDPGRNWRAVRTHATGQRNGKTFEVVAEYEYASGPDNLPSRVTVRDNWKDSDGKVTPFEMEMAFELKRLSTLPDTSEFTLSAFGLPEPFGVEWPKRSYTWVWLLAVGVGLVLATLVFRRMSRRAAARRAAAA